MFPGSKQKLITPSQDRLHILSCHLAVPEVSSASSISCRNRSPNLAPSTWGRKEPRGHPQSAVSAATVVLPFPVEHVLEDQGSTPDLLNLIDVTPPYLRLSAYGVHNGSAWAVVERESDNPYELLTPMTHAEMCRHAGIVGELACAVANPIKSRHFYLAMKSEFKVSGPQGLDAEIGAQIELEARVSRLDKGLAATKIQVFIPGPKRHLYAEMKVTYLVMSEESFLKQLERPSCGHNFLNVVQATQNVSVPSPYVDPILLAEIERTSQDSCSAQLHFNDVRMTAGHFPDVPALPAAIVGANVIRLISLGFPGADGAPARLTVLRHTMRFRRLPMLGDTLSITCSRAPAEHGHTQVRVHVVDKSTNRDVMIAELVVAMACGRV